MKRISAFIGLSALVLALPAAAQVRLDLRLKAGYAYADFGDFNANAAGYRAFFEIIKPAGYSLDGELATLHSGYDLELETVLSLTPFLSVGLETGLLRASGGPFLFSLKKPLGAVDYSLKETPYARAIPVKASLLFFPVSRGPVKLFVKVGGGAYFALLDQVRMTDEGLSDWIQSHTETKATGFGLHGGLGLEIGLTKGLAFLLEGEGRYAPIKDFQGTQTWSSATSPEQTTSGTYYFSGVYIFPSSVKLLLFEANPPDSSYYPGVRKAVFDFSGFSIRAGLVIRL